MKKNTKNKIIGIVVALCALAGVGTGVLPEWLGDGEVELGEVIQHVGELLGEDGTEDAEQSEIYSIRSVDLGEISEYDGEPYVAIQSNVPDFEGAEITTEAYEYYSELDGLGRCGVTMACLGQELMPTEDRESISHVKPTGWVQEQYDFVDGKSLYNRCHLIGFQLAGENANEKNLITGTRYMNTIGMLPFENMVADYIKETGNHVMYRVTPIYDGDNLVAHGVQMEGYSVEDEGDGIYFNVYVYNVQPGVEIDYVTGENWASDIK